MINMSLDDKEQQALIALLDAAVKALGLQAAEAAVHFTRKLAEAKAAAAKKEPPHLVEEASAQRAVD